MVRGAKFLQIDHRAHRAADQPLDLAAPAVEPAFRDVARLSGQRRIGQHRIFGRQPAAGDALIFHPARDGFLDHHAAEHPRVSHRHQDRSARVRRDAEFEIYRAQLIGWRSSRRFIPPKLDEVASMRYRKNRGRHNRSHAFGAPCSQVSWMAEKAEIAPPLPKDFSKKSLFPVDEAASGAIFVIPPEAGLPSRETDRGGSRILGLQIGTQFCPGMIATSLRRRRTELSSATGLSFFDARKLRRTAGSLKSTYRVVNTTF